MRIFSKEENGWYDNKVNFVDEEDFFIGYNRDTGGVLEASYTLPDRETYLGYVFVPHSFRMTPTGFTITLVRGFDHIVLEVENCPVFYVKGVRYG